MPSKSSLATEPITSIQRLFRDGSCSPHDLLDSVLDNIKRRDLKVHAYLFLAPEEKLRAEAESACVALKKGNSPALCGIPMAVKDNTYVSGMPCTGGSKILENFYPEKDAFFVSKLRSEGAIVLGKTNLDEMAAFGIATDNPHYGRTFNPWNLGRIPGGSSGGSAAAVASGEAVAATGSDTGGSVRIPASFCGLVGLKPTYGRVGRTGTVTMSWSLDTLGVITRSVRDAALLCGIIQGRDQEDSSTLDAPEPEPYPFQDSPDLGGLKLGILSNPLCAFDEEVARAFSKSVDVVAGLGAEVLEFEMPELKNITPVIFAIALSETSAFHEEWFRTHPELYGRTLRSYVQLGHGILATQYIKAQRARTLIISRILEKMKQVDVILTPTAPSVAPRLQQETISIGGKNYPAFQILTENTYPINLVGLPAISIPNGFAQGMPTGLQMISSHWKEQVLFQVGDAYQQVTDFHKKVPEV